MNKYYHRGNGEVVLPETHPFLKESIPQQRAEIIANLSVYAYCNPINALGWFEGREVKQLQNANKTYWGECSDFVFDIANDNVRRIWIEPVAVRCNYEQEAQELYPDIPAYNKAFTLTERASHIKARQMSEQEIRELREENERLKTLLYRNYKSWHIQFYRATADLTARQIDDMFKEHYSKFKQQNNIS